MQNIKRKISRTNICRAVKANIGDDALSKIQIYKVLKEVATAVGFPLEEILGIMGSHYKDDIQLLLQKKSKYIAKEIECGKALDMYLSDLHPVEKTSNNEFTD